uniref:C-type lectin domain-containing protein n=1 Tax=Romanomermis culicivorax TaxID=13658 RepID=A0A915HGD0_ROMCU
MLNIAYGNGSWWLLGGYGTQNSSSSFYWYRNVLGYPETNQTLGSFWPSNQPDNAGQGEYFLSMNKQLMNDIPATYAAGFVCQVDPSLPMPENNNLNGTIISTSSETCSSPWVRIDKLYYYFINNTFSNVASAVDACKNLDPRATLPEFRDWIQWKAILNYLTFQLMKNVSNGNGLWWFVGGYGTAANRSSFYWYRNVLGYPETYPILDTFWTADEPNNYIYNEEFILSINTLLLNDLPARKIPMNSQPSTRHRMYPLGVTQVSPGKWQDTKGNWVFSDWLPYYPDTSDPNKNCVMIVDYNGYMWENRVCGYNDSILWAFCQLNCSEPSPNCPNNYIDGFYYNLPNCYFRPNTTGSTVYVFCSSVDVQGQLWQQCLVVCRWIWNLH